MSKQALKALNATLRALNQQHSKLTSLADNVTKQITATEKAIKDVSDSLDGGSTKAKGGKAEKKSSKKAGKADKKSDKKSSKKEAKKASKKAKDDDADEVVAKVSSKKSKKAKKADKVEKKAKKGDGEKKSLKLGKPAKLLGKKKSGLQRSPVAAS